MRRMGTQQQQFGDELAFRRRGLCVSGSAHVTVYLPERTETGGPTYRIGPDCAGRA